MIKEEKIFNDGLEKVSEKKDNMDGISSLAFSNSIGCSPFWAKAKLTLSLAYYRITAFLIAISKSAKLQSFTQLEKSGHQHSKTTEIYAHVSTESIGKIKSPLDNLNLQGGGDASEGIKGESPTYRGKISMPAVGYLPLRGRRKERKP